MLIFSSLYHALRLEKGGGSMPNSGTVVSNPNIPSTI
jgi:hypothetical protein